AIARRFQELIGGGNKFLVRRYWQLSALSGLSVNEEKSTDGTVSDLLLEFPVVLRFGFFRYRHPNIQVNASQFVFFGLTQKGRIRCDTNVNFSWELVKHFWLTFNPYANFDNQPPEGNSNFDYGWAINLSYR